MAISATFPPGIGPCASEDDADPSPSYQPTYGSPLYGGDLDCADFSGPVYDQETNAEHGLDADGDGVGCE